MSNEEIKTMYSDMFKKEEERTYKLSDNEILTLMRISIEDGFDYLEEYLRDYDQ